LKILKIAGTILVLGTLFSVAASQDQDTSSVDVREVVSTGVGSIINGDVAHARDDAIEDALRKGVENAMGLLIQSETLVENYQLIDDRIFSKTEGYIQNYDIVREGKRGEYLYEVTVRAAVRMANLKNDLEGIALLMRRKNMPRIMIMIKERNIGEGPGIFRYFEADMNSAETAIMESFMEKGFKFVDRATVMRNLDRRKASALLEGDASEAAALGRSLGAEVIITGKAFAKASETTAYGTTLRSQNATVSVRAIRTDTGDIIAVGSKQAKYSNQVDDAAGGVVAIQKACKELAEDIMEKILDRWQADISEGASLTLKVRGVTTLAQLTKFKSALPYFVRGLSEVVQRDWYGGFATLEVVMKGTSEDLARRLSGKEIDEYKIRIIGMTQNSVTLELVKKDQ